MDSFKSRSLATVFACLAIGVLAEAGETTAVPADGLKTTIAKDMPIEMKKKFIGRLMKTKRPPKRRLDEGDAAEDASGSGDPVSQEDAEGVAEDGDLERRPRPDDHHNNHHDHGHHDYHNDHSDDESDWNWNWEDDNWEIDIDIDIDIDDWSWEDWEHWEDWEDW